MLQAGTRRATPTAGSARQPWTAARRAGPGWLSGSRSACCATMRRTRILRSLAAYDNIHVFMRLIDRMLARAPSEEPPELEALPAEEAGPTWKRPCMAPLHGEAAPDIR